MTCSYRPSEIIAIGCQLLPFIADYCRKVIEDGQKSPRKDYSPQRPREHGEDKHTVQNRHIPSETIRVDLRYQAEFKVYSVEGRTKTAWERFEKFTGMPVEIQEAELPMAVLPTRKMDMDVRYRRGGIHKRAFTIQFSKSNAGRIRHAWGSYITEKNIVWDRWDKWDRKLKSLLHKTN